MVTRDSARPQGGAEPPEGERTADRAGFTIVEVIIAIVILAVGLLGMAGTTLLVVQQTTMADMTSDRSAAVQSTIERLRAASFENVVSGSDSVGSFDVSWSVTNGGRWKQVEIVTVGPGSTTERGFPVLMQSVPDTFSYRIIGQ